MQIGLERGRVRNGFLWGLGGMRAWWVESAGSMASHGDHEVMWALEQMKSWRCGHRSEHRGVTEPAKALTELADVSLEAGQET